MTATGFVPVEKTVAGCACRYTTALVGLLGFESEVHCGRACGDDQCIAGVAAIIAIQPERSRSYLGGVNMVVNDFRVEALRVAQHAVHQFGALQTFDIAGPVVDIGRCHQLTALFDARHHDRVQVGACRVYGSRVSGWSGAQDQNPAMFWITHV